MTPLPESHASITGHYYDSAKTSCVYDYLLQPLQDELHALSVAPQRIFDLGCGNGAVANWLAQQGFQVQGVDPSDTGIAIAHDSYPELDLRQGSAYDDLASTFGTFPLLASLEVVEHVYAPRRFASCVAALLSPGGHALISTPYHGYLKNVALAVMGKMDSHFTALWDDGHIKFWSRKTITTLLQEAGLDVVRIRRIGRIPPLAKTMLIVARKPVEAHT